MTRFGLFARSIPTLLAVAMFAFPGLSHSALPDNHACVHSEGSSTSPATEKESIPIVTVTVTPCTCAGGSNGTALAVAVGLPPFSYVWSTGAVTANIAGLAAGNYTVTVTDGLGQSATATALILAPLPIDIDLTVSDLLTCLVPSVTVTALATGGNLGLSYQWSNGAIGPVMTVDVAANYTVTVTDLLGCTSTSIATVNANINPPNADAGPPVNLTCLLPQVQLNGLASDIGVNFSLLWSASAGGNILSGANTATPTVDAAGTYTLQVTNLLSGCTSTSATTVLLDIDPPSINITGGILSCLLDDLQLNLATNASLATHLWSGPNGFTSTQQNPTVSAAGTYGVTVTNTLTGCTNTGSTTVTVDIDVPSINIIGGQLGCSGNPLQLILSTNAALAAYLWVGPNGFSSTQQNPTISVAGTYGVTVTNTLTGCTNTGSIVIIGDAPPTVSITGGQLGCGSNGVQLTLATNAAAATFLWSGPNGFSSTQQNPTVTTAGTYNVTVTNTANGCSNTSSTTVTSGGAPPAVSASGGQITCASNSIQLTLTTNATAATFLWSGPNGFSSTQQNPTVTTAGAYNVTVTNTSNGCTNTGSATVTQDASLPTVSIATPGNFGCLATAVLLNAGGSSQGPNFTYLWTTTNGSISAGANTLVATVNAAGSYKLVITNTATGCSASATITVQQAPILVLTAGAVQSADCGNTATGSATVNVSGGTQPYAYLWSNGQISATASSLAVGSHTVIVTDANGCTATLSVTIQGGTDQTPPTLNCTQNVLVACGGSPLTFGLPTAADNCSNTPIVSQVDGLPSGSVFPDCPHILTFKATDDAGNASTCSMLVVVVPAPTVTVDQVVDDSNGNGNGSIKVSVGCSGSVSYNWKGPNGFTANSEDISGLFAGTYTLIVTNAAGCSVSLTIVVQNLVGTDDPERNIVVQASPNPTRNTIRLVITDDVELLAGRIMDPQGRLLQTLNESEITREIFVKDLAPGMYFMYLLTGERTEHVIRFVKAE